jgi:hypothetical protein
MAHEITETEAQHALETVERRRQDGLAEINVPGWYWPVLGGGWVGLGAVSQWGPAWANAVATLAFGALHAFFARRALSGRHGSSKLSLRRDAVSRRIPLYVIGFLLVMVALTVAIGFGLDGDGAEHPAFDAGLAVGVLVLAAGPALMAAVRRRGRRSGT